MKRLLLKYQKTGRMAYLSHLETMRALERALRRAGLPLTYSQGFSPHPRISSTPALPVGVGSLGEYLEVGLDGEVELSDLAERINRGMPQNLRISTAEILPEHFPKMSRWVHYALYRVEKGRRRQRPPASYWPCPWRPRGARGRREAFRVCATPWSGCGKRKAGERTTGHM